MKDFQYITNSSPEYIESMYQEFVKFLEGFDFAVSSSKQKTNGAPAVAEPKVAIGLQVDWMKEIQVYRMILGYRNKGHLIAKTNPIRERKDRGANLDLGFFGFTEADLDKNFNAGNLIGLGATSLRNIVQHLTKCYASNVGI